MANLFKTNKAGGAAPSGNVPITIDNVGTTSDIDVAGYATASVTTQGLYKPTTVKDNTGSPYTTNGEKTITGLENNTGVKIKINVSAPTTGDVLWSNSNPTSAFSPQDVPLNSSFDNYTYIKFRYYPRTTDTSKEYVTIIPKSVLKSNIGGDACAVIGGCFSGSTTAYARAIKAVSYTSLNIGYAYGLMQAGQTAGSISILPIDIQGI